METKVLQTNNNLDTSQELGKKRKAVTNGDEMQGSYLGPSFSEKDIENTLKNLGANYEKHNEENLINISWSNSISRLRVFVNTVILLSSDSLPSLKIVFFSREIPKSSESDSVFSSKQLTPFSNLIFSADS